MDPALSLPPSIEATVKELEEAGVRPDREFLEAIYGGVRVAEAVEVEPPTLDGAALLADPDAALARFKAEGGVVEQLVVEYIEGESLLHLLRSGSQPAMLRATLKAMVPALARQMCAEAGVAGVAAMMVAEQAAEARGDEAYHRALAGEALDSNDLKKAEMLNKAADRFSRRMLKATEQLFRMRRPKVTVNVRSVGNLNLGEQKIVNESDDADLPTPSPPPALSSR